MGKLRDFLEASTDSDTFTGEELSAIRAAIDAETDIGLKQDLRAELAKVYREKRVIEPDALTWKEFLGENKTPSF